MGRNFPHVCLLMVCLFLVPSLVFAETTPPRVIFDEGHDQRFLVGEAGELHLSKLAGLLRDQGAQVAAVTAPLSDDTLKGAVALVISGPFHPLKPGEVDAVARFLEHGGRLVMMLHIGIPLSDLLNRLGVEHSNGVLHERENSLDTDQNFRVTDLAASPLFEGITNFSAYGAWALNPGPSSAAVARTSARSWVDLNGDRKYSEGDADGPFALAVAGTHGSGSFVVFGDDAIFQNRYLDENNHRLAGNLAAWLLSVK